MSKTIDVPSFLLGRGAGGGGGTGNYEDLENKPSINGVTLEGSLTGGDLGLPVITYGTQDLTPGVSELAEGTMYFMYE